MQQQPWGGQQPQGWGAPAPQGYPAQPTTDPWGQPQQPAQQYAQPAPQVAPQQAAPAQNLPAVQGQGGGALALPSVSAQEFADAGLSTGLDDLGIEELRTPRIKIDHPEGQFEDAQNGGRYAALNVVILGFIKQRIFWPREVSESANDDVPICKSNDFERGMPNTDTTSRRVFPWDESNFNPNLITVNRELNRVLLPCSSCSFQQWTGDSRSDRTPPRCSEVWNLIVMYDPWGNGQLQPAFLALKRSAIKSVKAYLATFKQQGLPPYVAWTQMTLDRQKRGTVVYSSPIFTVVGHTDRTQWKNFSDNFTALADFAKTIRPLTGGAETGVQQEFVGDGFNQSGQYVPQPGVVPPTVAESNGQQVYYPQPMPPQQPAQQQYYQPNQPQPAQQYYQQPPAQQPAQQFAPQPPQQYAPPAPAQTIQQPAPQQPAPPVQHAPAPPVQQMPEQPAQTAPPVEIEEPPAPPVQAAPPAAAPPAPPIQSPAPPAPPMPTPTAPPVTQVAPPPVPVAPTVSAPVVPSLPAPASLPVPQPAAWAGDSEGADDDSDLPF